MVGCVEVFISGEVMQSDSGRRQEMEREDDIVELNVKKVWFLTLVIVQFTTVTEATLT